jgi:hypothetical protein
MTRDGEKQLREAIRHFHSQRLIGRRVDGEQIAPGCVFGVLTRDEVDDLQLSLAEVKAELKWVRATILAAIVTAGVGSLMRLWR